MNNDTPKKDIPEIPLPGKPPVVPSPPEIIPEPRKVDPPPPVPEFPVPPPEIRPDLLPERHDI
jgi:hypothetical protein